MKKEKYAQEQFVVSGFILCLFFILLYGLAIVEQYNNYWKLKDQTQQNQNEIYLMKADITRLQIKTGLVAPAISNCEEFDIIYSANFSNGKCPEDKRFDCIKGNITTQEWWTSFNNMHSNYQCGCTIYENGSIECGGEPECIKKLLEGKQ